MRLLLAFLLAISAFPNTVAGSQQPLTRLQDGSREPLTQNLELAGQTGGAVTIRAVDGTRAYVTVGPRLAVLDLAAAGPPAMLGLSAPVLLGASDLAVAGSYAYTAGPGPTIRIFDVSNPAALREVGSVAVDSKLEWLRLVGPYLYGGSWESRSGTGTLLVMDITDPLRPTRVGSSSGQASFPKDGVAHNRVLAFRPWGCPVAFETPRLEQERPLGTEEECLGIVLSVTVARNFAWMLWSHDGRNGPWRLKVMDLSDPRESRDVSEGWANYSAPVFVVGDTAYVGDKVLDVRDPAAPRDIGINPHGPFFMVAGSFGFAKRRGNRDSEILMVDLKTQTPRALGSTSAFWPESLSNVETFATVGDVVYVPSPDPDQPPLGEDRAYRVFQGPNFQPRGPEDSLRFKTMNYGLGTLGVSGGGTWLKSESALYVAEGNDPGWLQEVSFAHDPGSRLLGGVLAGDLLFLGYIGDWDAELRHRWPGVRILDVADPISPHLLSTYELPEREWPNSLAVAGDRLYVTARRAAGGSSMRVLDVSNPAEPAEVGLFSLGKVFGERVPLHVKNGYMFIPDNGSLAVFDVSDGGTAVDVAYVGPRSPSEARGSIADEMVVVGDLAYVASFNDGLRIVDISDPRDPREIAFYGAPLLRPRAVAVHGDVVSVAGGPDGLLSFRLMQRRLESPSILTAI